MSFTPAGGGADRAFELVRRSLLQDECLSFADALTAEHIQQAFDAEGVWFGEADSDANASPEEDDGVVYTPAVTLWAMLSQALFTDVQRACRAAVQRVAVYYALLGRDVSSTNTGAYCRARAKVTEGVVQRLVEGVASRCEGAVPDEWLWHGFRPLVIDGSTFSMPDTEANQAEYPQPTTQAEGLGFPILRAVALTSLATGMVRALATGPYAGKETGETALFRTLFAILQSGDLVLADRYYGGWFMLALLLELRDIKATMSLDVLRRQTPEAVRQELWTGLLAYNLIRQSMLQSALASARQPHELSFAASLQMLANTWVLAAVLPLVTVSARERLVALRILNGHSHRVANRPNRVEPRAVKRRPSPLALLTELRATVKARLIAGPKT